MADDDLSNPCAPARPEPSALVRVSGYPAANGWGFRIRRYKRIAANKIGHEARKLFPPKEK